MDEPTIHRGFKPFFTTKTVGSNTGLGLSQVYAWTAAIAGMRNARMGRDSNLS